MTDMRVLVTGGAGYIGAHTLVAMLAAGQRPLVLDNFSNGSPEAVRRVERLCGAAIPLVEGDIRQTGLVQALLAREARRGDPVRAVLHGRLQGGRRIGGRSAQVLRQQRVRLGGAVARHARGGRDAAGVQLVGHCLWRAARCRSPRRTAGAGQPVRPQQADGRTDAARPVRRRAGVRRGDAALLQPDRRPSQRPDRRKPARRAQQPVSLHHPGGGGAPAVPERVRR